MKSNKIVTWVAIIAVITSIVLGVKLIKDNKETKAKSSSDSVWTDELDIEDLRSQGKPVLIDFTASWCVPCKTFNPILEETKKELGDDVIIKIIDVDDSRDIAKNYPVMVIPTQILYNADGSPFEPSANIGIYGFKGYSKENEKTGKEEDLTTHEGAMTKEELMYLLTEMSHNHKGGEGH